MKKLMTSLVLIAVALMVSAFSGCSTDAEVASQNLSKSADMFEITRRVVFYNGITGEYILVVEGLCSIEADTFDDQLELTCKTGEGEYKKHFLGLSDNVTYFAEQVEPAAADPYRYRVIFKPEAIVPNIDFKMSDYRESGREWAP